MSRTHFELLGTLNKASIPIFICEEIGTERWIKKKVTIHLNKLARL
ncbi:hypothetical protein BCBMB205_20380 [Bacillus sp. CN2]|nr:hypothetical protein BCBMB205_20380 [Bacillus velezensis]ARZ58375.1 hypothetical protein BAGQ_2142 [Bacillus velezensis]GFR56778.1 hypothetical protein BCBMB205_20380 [Bacillus sp. CN2]